MDCKILKQSDFIIQKHLLVDYNKQIYIFDV